MPYTTEQELIDRYGEDEILQLSDRDQSGSIDSDVVVKAITDADNEINSYLAARYTLPLTATAPVLVLVSSDVARYRLHENDATDEVAERYSIQRKFLEALASGKAVLIDANGKPINDSQQPTGSGSPKYCAGERKWTDDVLDQY